MADKAIGSLVEATVINDADRFVLEQSGQAKQISGATMISELAEALDGHGGIQSIDLVSGEGNVKTYRITFADGSTYDYEVRDGESGNYAVVAGNLAPYSDASGATQSIPFLSQGTGRGNGSATVSAGNYCQLKKKLGNTVCVNQLANPRNYSNGSTTDSLTYTRLRIRNTNNSSEYYDFGNIVATGFYSKIAVINFSADSCSIRHNGAQIDLPITTTGAVMAGRTYLFVANFNGVNPSETDGLVIADMAFIDLTLWFGSNDRIPSDLLSHPENWGRYYAGSLGYAAGYLDSADGTVMTSIGRQMWDEETEDGYISSTGVLSNYEKAIRSKNYRPCVCGESYYYRVPTGMTGFAICWYDSAKNFIERVGDTVIVTAPSNACFFKLSLYNYKNFSPSYNHDITISLYYPGESGYDQYYPYTVLAQIDTGSETLYAYDEKVPDGTIYRNTLRIDLGTLFYTALSGGNNVFFANVTGVPNDTGNGNMPKLKCAKYVTVAAKNATAWASETEDKVMSLGYDSARIYIRDTAFSDASLIPAALSGVYIEVEAATPTTEQGTAFAENIPCDPVGSMSWENTEGIPQGAEIFYPYDYAGTLDSMIDALPSANGTYTFKATVANGKITYSWVAG